MTPSLGILKTCINFIKNKNDFRNLLIILFNLYVIDDGMELEEIARDRRVDMGVQVDIESVDEGKQHI